MKRVLVIVSATFLALQVRAQSVEEGVKLYNYERYESAKQALLPLAANNPEANYYLGLSEIGLDSLDAAKAVFGKDPSNFYNEAGMARVLFMEGKKDEAGKLLNDIVDHAKKKDWERYKVAADAITYTKGGDINSAIAWYQQALEKNQDAMIYIGLGDAYLKMQTGGGEAMNNYEKAVEKGTANSLAYSRIGYLWYVAHNYDDALKSYNQAKDADPANPLPYRDLAQAYQRAGKYENALQNDEEYLSKSDKNINDQINYANILFLAKKYPEAAAKMEELIGKGAEKPYMYRIIGYSAYETKDYPKALSNMQTFFSKEKDTSELINDDYIYSGKIYIAMAESDSVNARQYTDSATAYFNRAVANDTAADKSELYRAVADGYKDAKQYGEAGKWYGKIIAAKPDAPALDYFYWGYWNYFGKNYDEAAKAFAQMKTKYPKEGSAYYWIARVAAAKDSEAKTGGAVQPYKDWLDFNAEGYEHKDADLMYAYQYLTYYYYNQKNKAEAMTWDAKILEKDPSNEFALSIKKYFETPQKEAPQK